MRPLSSQLFSTIKKRGTSVFFVVTLLAWILMIAPSFSTLVFGASVQTPPSKDAPTGLSQKEIKSLIQRLEDPSQRAALIEELKLLLKVQETASRKEIPVVSPFTQIYTWVVERLDSILTSRIRSFQNLPERFREFAKKWRETSGKYSLAFELARLLIVFVAVLFLLSGLRWALRYQPPDISGDGGDIPFQKRLWVVLRRWAGLALPSIILLLAGSLFAVLFRPGQMQAELLFILLWSIFLDHTIIGAVRSLLSPEQPLFRLLPVSDEVSGYLSLWARRIIRVGVWGEALSRASFAMGLGWEVEGTISSLYRLILLLQALVLVLQNRDTVRETLSADEPEDSGKGVRAAIAFWNIFIGRWHFIAVPYLIVFFLLWTSESAAGLKFLISSTILTIVILVAAYFVNQAIQLVTKRFFAVSDRLKNVIPGIEERANRYTPIVSRVLSVVVWGASSILIFDAWGIPTLETLFSGPGVAMIRILIGVLFTAAMATLLIEMIQAGSEYILSGRRDARGEPVLPTSQQRTLLPLGYSVVKWLIIGIAAMVILNNIGVNIAPVLAGAGILGLAIGFGAQSLVKDIITGIFMLIEDNIAVGDIVKVKDIGGQVERFTLRSVRLRDYDGNVHVIPNSAIDVVTNFTKDYSRAVFDIGVAYRENVDEVIGIIREVGEEMRADPEWENEILEPVEIAGLDRFGDSSIVIRGRFKTRPIKQWSVRREFHRRIKNTFDERGIEIPFPYRTLTWAEPKETEKEKSTGRPPEFPSSPPIPPGDSPKSEIGSMD